MAKKLDPMDLKQLISLHLDGLSNREIGKILGISRNTINAYMRYFQESSYSLKELLHFEDSALLAIVPSKEAKDSSRYQFLLSYLKELSKTTKQPGFTFQFHYQEYVASASNPYSYTQFMEYYHRNYGKVKGSMKLEHEAAKELFIDFAGKKLSVQDKQTGKEQAVEVFVAILPSSHYTYVTACKTQKREDLITCCQNALHYFGGVPKAIVSDNLKSAVTKSSKYEATINRSFKDFARHYNCVINPTRSYAPQDKALVENAVHLAYQRIYYPLREMVFFSLEDLNTEIEKRLEVYNGQLFQIKDTSRKELFLLTEKQHLKPLPKTLYQLKQYRRAKVQKMGYVYFSPDKTYYSVPYRYIGKETMQHYTQDTVAIYYNHQRIAIHDRVPIKGNYITNKEHLSSTHKFYSDWSPEFFKNKATTHGEAVVKCVTLIIDNAAYPEIGYKRVMGLLQLHKSYGSQRLNNACKRALQANIVSYKTIKNILENNLDQSTLFQQQEQSSNIPDHDNIRGESAYK